MRRIYVEHLPPEVLGEPATIALLQKFEVQPLVALPPHAETPAMARALAKLAQAGLNPGIWPLLTDDQGYWPSVHNASFFVSRVEQALAFAPARTVVVDLEPPLPFTRALTLGPRWTALWNRKRYVNSSEGRTEWHQGQRTLHQLATELHQGALETLVPVIPPVMFGEPWQRWLGAPISDIPWRVVSPMFYSTLLAAALPFRRQNHARHLVAWAARRWAKQGQKAASVGLVGTGKLSEERTYDQPEALAQDIRALTAAGLTDLSLFALEGVLFRGAPETWLLAFTAP